MKQRFLLAAGGSFGNRQSMPRTSWWILCLFVLCSLGADAVATSPATVRIPLADGFDYPVGKPDAKGYYKSRGFRPNGHLGDDWNGLGGGNSDLGDPIFAMGNGYVVFARDVRLGWGNVVIVRHAYKQSGVLKIVDSLYGHLQSVAVREGQIVKKGDLIGKMGNNRGMYLTHLHFEVRKNLNIGMDRTKYAKDFSNYWNPTQFVALHRKLPGSTGLASIPLNTFGTSRTFGKPVDESVLKSSKGSKKAPSGSSKSKSKLILKINRFEDLLNDI